MQQEWWGEYPPQDRTDHVGLYRDVAYRWHLVNRLSGKNATELPELLDLDGGVFGISEDMAVPLGLVVSRERLRYPFAYHDGRSRDADPEIATYKNGLAYHQQQKFFLSWPVGLLASFPVRTVHLRQHGASLGRLRLARPEPRPSRLRQERWRSLPP